MNKEKLEQLLLETDKLYCSNKNPGIRLDARALVLNLNTEKFEVVDIPANWINGYVAGPALAARLWGCFAGSNIDKPDDYEQNNPIVVTVSPSAGKNFPMGESLAIAFRSPQTKSLTLNVCSSSFGARLQSCGFQALIVLGRLRRLGTVYVSRIGVEFRISDSLFEKPISECESSISENESAIGSGPAADNHVIYAGGFTDGKMTGRGGLGYVFGMKNLKAAICEAPLSTQRLELPSIKELRDRVEKSPRYEDLRKSGTSFYINNANREGWAPISNYSKRTDPRLFHLSGSEVERKCPSASSSCYGCLLKCCHNTNTSRHVPGYEAILMLGSNCNCYDLNKVVDRYTLCVEMGLDPISVGNVLGFVYKAQAERKIELPKNIDFSDNDAVLQLIRDIGKREGIGDLLGNGVAAVGAVSKMPEQAYHINGLECSCFDFRGAPLQALNSACGRWFTNYFGLDRDLTKGNEPFWMELNEELVMGLECYGFSPSILHTEIGYLNKRNRFFISHSNWYATRFFRLESVTNAMTEFYSRKITINDIKKAGVLCRYLIDEINALINPTKDYIPDYFILNPESNSKRNNVVRIQSLLREYYHRRICGLVRQYSKRH